MDRPLLQPTDRGLWCEAGGFHVDPWRPVEVAVVTHAHADHAASGCGRYITAAPGAGLLSARVRGADGEVPEIEPREYDEPFDVGGVRLSLHPAGHTLGSAQVRIEAPNASPDRNGGVWVVTGDYRPSPEAHAPNTTCAPFEAVTCDTLLTESTFGLPIYRWRDPAVIAEEMNEWWRANAAGERTSVIFAYALGKAQRVLSMLDASIGPIGLHGAVDTLVGVYREAGVTLPATQHANRDNATEFKGRGVIIAPPSTDGTPWLRRFKGKHGSRTAFASGWMAVRGRRRWRSADKGFVVSDHADWEGLLATVRATGASRVGVTHGYAEQVSRYLREVGAGNGPIESFVVPTRYEGEPADSGEADS
ncbi:MAG: ligase-associated DNA damage response exonuclease [Planctomycetota bacterium]